MLHKLKYVLQIQHACRSLSQPQEPKNDVPVMSYERSGPNARSAKKHARQELLELYKLP